MAKINILKRGFKASAERLAKQYREILNIHPCGPLCAFKLAEHLQIPIINATEYLKLPNEIALLQGANGYDCGWSALTMTAISGKRIIIHNPFHSVARQQSNLMHELSHIICKHERNQKEYDFQIPIGMREYDELQEEEAKCLGATLQLSTPCLLWAKKNELTKEGIASHFNASLNMVSYRLNMTGISKQFYLKKAIV